MARRFEVVVEVDFQEIMARLKGNRSDLAALCRRYQQAEAQDYLGCRIGRRVRATLQAARGRDRS